MRWKKLNSKTSGKLSASTAYKSIQSKANAMELVKLQQELDELKTIMRKQHSDQQEEIRYLKLLINQQNDKLETQEKEINELKSLTEQVDCVSSNERMNTFLDNYKIVLYSNVIVTLRSGVHIVTYKICGESKCNIDNLKLCKIMDVKLHFKINKSYERLEFEYYDSQLKYCLFGEFVIDEINDNTYYTHYYIIYLVFGFRFITKDDVDITETIIKFDFDLYTQRLERNNFNRQFYTSLDEFIHKFKHILD